MKSILYCYIIFLYNFFFQFLSWGLRNCSRMLSYFILQLKERKIFLAVKLIFILYNSFLGFISRVKFSVEFCAMSDNVVKITKVICNKKNIMQFLFPHFFCIMTFFLHATWKMTKKIGKKNGKIYSFLFFYYHFPFFTDVGKFVSRKMRFSEVMFFLIQFWIVMQFYAKKNAICLKLKWLCW